MGISFEHFLKEAIRDVVREELASEKPPPLELITIEQAAIECDCGKSVIEDLVREAAATGFPAVQLGPRTIRIDRNRLRLWLNAGGLKNKHTDEMNGTWVPGLVIAGDSFAKERRKAG